MHCPTAEMPVIGSSVIKIAIYQKERIWLIKDSFEFKAPLIARP